MFNRTVLKAIASVVIVSYLSVFNVSSLLAAEVKMPETSQLLAQASANPATGGKETAEEEKALRQIYTEKIQRLEAEMNSTRGSRNTILTISITSLVIGAGLVSGAETAKTAVNKMPTDTPQKKDDVDQALESIEAVKSVSNGFFGVGAVALFGYLIYSAVINSKARKVERLRSELDIRFAPRGLTPEYLQRNESVAAVIEEINDAKRGAGSARTLQSLFSRVAIASLFSGGFLYTLAVVGNNVIDEINIDEQSDKEKQDREDAKKEIDNIERNGIILMGVGGGAALASFFFGRRAKSKENLIDNLENSLLRVAGRIDIQPKMDGFRLVYTQQF